MTTTTGSYNTVPLDVEQQHSPTVVATTLDAPRNWKGKLRAYVWSHDLCEIVTCVLYFLLSCSIYIIQPTGNQRPIPYQFLEDLGVYILNLVNNATLSGPTFNNETLVLLAGVLPFVVQVLVSKFFGKLGDTHSAICVPLVAQGTTLLITEWVKVYVGYLRPVFYEFCVPSNDYQECTGTPSEIADVRKSFPSGHSSMAFCGLAILTLYLHNRFGVPRVRALQQVSVDEAAGLVRWKVVYTTKTPIYYHFISLFSLSPLALAVWIAASRVVDNMHFPADVVGGAVLGTGIATFVNGLWYAD